MRTRFVVTGQVFKIRYKEINQKMDKAQKKQHRRDTLDIDDPEDPVPQANIWTNGDRARAPTLYSDTRSQAKVSQAKQKFCQNQEPKVTNHNHSNTNCMIL